MKIFFFENIYNIPTNSIKTFYNKRILVLLSNIDSNRVDVYHTVHNKCGVLTNVCLSVIEFLVNSLNNPCSNIYL